MMDMNLGLGRIQYTIRETIEDRTLNRPDSGLDSTVRLNQKEEKTYQSQKVKSCKAGKKKSAELRLGRRECIDT